MFPLTKSDLWESARIKHSAGLVRAKAECLFCAGLQRSFFTALFFAVGRRAGLGVPAGARRAGVPGARAAGVGAAGACVSSVRATGVRSS